MEWNTENILELTLSIIICQLAGVVGTIFTIYGLTCWYKCLKKPSFTPPNWIFGPVWVTLYFLMGISLFLVWHHGLDNPQIMDAMMFFGIQLGLNAAWSVVFFGFRSISGGFMINLALWVAILVTIIKFDPISTMAALLLVPYLLWVTFASFLSFNLWKLNPNGSKGKVVFP